jgi:hypothetical protein
MFMVKVRQEQLERRSGRRGVSDQPLIGKFGRADKRPLSEAGLEEMASLNQAPPAEILQRARGEALSTRRKRRRRRNHPINTDTRETAHDSRFWIRPRVVLVFAASRSFTRGQNEVCE